MQSKQREPFKVEKLLPCAKSTQQLSDVMTLTSAPSAHLSPVLHTTNSKQKIYILISVVVVVFVVVVVVVSNDFFWQLDMRGCLYNRQGNEEF